MTAVDLDALDKLRSAATPGPWEVSVEPDTVWLSAPDEAWPAEVYGERRREDAALIVAAVNALPDLIADARKYRALREAVDGLAVEGEREAESEGFPVPEDAPLLSPARLRAVVAGDTR